MWLKGTNSVQEDNGFGFQQMKEFHSREVWECKH